MSNWCEYWSKSKFVNVKKGSYLLVNGEDTLSFFQDLRPGRTYGMIFLFSQPGTKGSTMARGEEASFLEGFLKEVN